MEKMKCLAVIVTSSFNLFSSTAGTQSCHSHAQTTDSRKLRNGLLGLSPDLDRMNTLKAATWKKWKNSFLVHFMYFLVRSYGWSN